MRVGFGSRLKLKFLGSRVTTDAGLLAYRELDETLGLTEMAPGALEDSRVGRNKQHNLLPLLRQSIYSRLAGLRGRERREAIVRRSRDTPRCRWACGVSLGPDQVVEDAVPNGEGLCVSSV